VVAVAVVKVMLRVLVVLVVFLQAQVLLIPRFLIRLPLVLAVLALHRLLQEGLMVQIPYSIPLHQLAAVAAVRKVVALPLVHLEALAAVALEEIPVRLVALEHRGKVTLVVQG
jgi:hypothetical protein